MRHTARRMFMMVLMAVTATTLSGQTDPAPAEPITKSVQDGAKHVRRVFTVAADQMSEDDYAFKPTPEVRSFGQLIAHVADTNYSFCSIALGEKAPVRNIEKTTTNREDLQKALAASFEYCEAAYAAMSDQSKARRMVEIMGKPRPALAALNFRNYHSLLHWGNAITYMRLRGKVPPSN